MERKITEAPIAPLNIRVKQEKETDYPEIAPPSTIQLSPNTYSVYCQSYHIPYHIYPLPTYNPYYSRPYALYGDSPNVLSAYDRCLTTSPLSGSGSRSKPLCRICMKVFTRVSSLKVHMRIHRGEKPYVCSECGKAFSQSGNLKVHMRIHNGSKPYGCNLCGRLFIQSSSLKSHMRSHNRHQKEGSDAKLPNQINVIETSISHNHNQQHCSH